MSTKCFLTVTSFTLTIYLTFFSFQIRSKRENYPLLHALKTISVTLLNIIYGDKRNMVRWLNLSVNLESASMLSHCTHFPGYWLFTGSSVLLFLNFLVKLSFNLTVKLKVEKCRHEYNGTVLQAWILLFDFPQGIKNCKRGKNFNVRIVILQHFVGKGYVYNCI